jgi:hypothetical protein
MNNPVKKLEDLTPADLENFPVWQYVNSDKSGETLVRPVKKMPVKSLTGRVVGTQVRLANGASVCALIGNLDADNPQLTHHFLTLSIFRNGRWFTMARYHDFDASERGPQALASFLSLQINEVFPILYDIGRFSLGDRAALTGTIEAEPREKLTRAQIIALAVP